MMQFTLQTCRTLTGRRVDVTLLVTRPTDVWWTERVARWLLGREPAPASTSEVHRASFVRVQQGFRFVWVERATGLTPTNWLAAVTGELRTGALEGHIAAVMALVGDHRTEAERQVERELEGGAR
jgi:hypothetical protein